MNFIMDGKVITFVCGRACTKICNIKDESDILNINWKILGFLRQKVIMFAPDCCFYLHFNQFHIFSDVLRILCSPFDMLNGLKISCRT